MTKLHLLLFLPYFVVNKYLLEIFHHLCCQRVGKVVIEVLCSLKENGFERMHQASECPPPTAPKQSSSQSSSQRLQQLNTEQRRQEVPLNLKHTPSLPSLSVSLSFSLSLWHTKTHIHADTYTQAINYTKWNSTHLRRDFSSQSTNSIRLPFSRKNGPSVSSSGHQPVTLFRLILTAVVNCI